MIFYKVIKTCNTNDLTPLEGGIIGGSVAGLDGFLAGYLSLSGDEGGVDLFVI